MTSLESLTLLSGKIQNRMMKASITIPTTITRRSRELSWQFSDLKRLSILECHLRRHSVILQKSPPLSLSQSEERFVSSHYDVQPKNSCFARPRQLFFILLLLLTGNCDGMMNMTTPHVLPENTVIHPMRHDNSLHGTYDDDRLVATAKTFIEHDGSRLLQQNCVYNQSDLANAMSLNRNPIDLCSSYITLNSVISADSKNIKFTCNLKITNGVKCTLDAQGLSRHIYAYEATLSFYDIVFINGYATDYGGATYLERSNVSMYRCEFMNNSARDGGGAIASIDSTLFLIGRKAKAAVAKNNAITLFGYGGFLGAWRSTVNITNYLLLSNSAQYGGAIHLQFTTLSTYRCDFMKNSADYGGGAISSYNATVILTGGEPHAAVAEHNKASWGGFLDEYYSTINITNYLFRNNSAANYGGAMEIGYSTLSTYRCKFMNNSAPEGGAIRSLYSTVNLKGGEAKAAVAKHNKATVNGGGFLYGFNSTISITNYLCLTNTAKGGGAINIYRFSLSIYRCHFMDNSAEYGGAISSYESTLNLIGGETEVAVVAENNKATYWGGFLFAWISSSTITNHLFRNNSAEYGGANFQLQGSSYYENAIFQNNSGLKQGGALYVAFEEMTLKNVVFQDNNAIRGTIRSFSSQIDLKNYSFRSSDRTTSTCNLFVTALNISVIDFLNYLTYNPNVLDNVEGSPLFESCINFPSLTSINNRRLDTKSIQADNHDYSTIFDPNDETYPSDHLFLTTNTSSESNLSIPEDSSPERIMASSTCVSSSAGLQSAVRSANPRSRTPTTISVCTPKISLGSRARRLQDENRSLATNILDGIDISNKNIILLCKRRRNARCTLDAGGMMRHFYGSGAKVQFRNIRFVNGYHQGTGGALLINNSDINLATCSFFNNTALSGAGALFVNQTKLIIHGTKTDFRQNGGRGTPIEVHSSNATVQNVTFVDNKMTKFGDGIFVFKSDVDLSNLSFNQSSSKMSSNCSLFVSVNPTNRSDGATCVAL